MLKSILNVVFTRAQFAIAPGVLRTRVGYAGGKTQNPSYHNIGDHIESIEIEFDPRVISYETLLSKFWSSHNPTTPHKRQYMSAIFFSNEEQRQLAVETMKEEQRRYNGTILTLILPMDTFTEAESYHQKYLLRSYPKLNRLFNFDDRELVRSQVAAKLNGYVGGYGTMMQFEREAAEWKLDDRQVQTVKSIIARGGIHASCGL